MTPSNPWLDISEADYVGHMSSPAVGQRVVLNHLLREALEASQPRDVLILGCSTGNGFERVDPAVTRRVMAIDVNPAYLQRLLERFPNPGFELDLQCADLGTCRWPPKAFDLVHAALVLEYVDWPEVLPRIAGTLRAGATFSVVLQRPSTASPAVTPTEFTRLRLLETLFRFVEPDDLVASAGEIGLDVVYRRTEPLPSGKAFEVLRFVSRP